MTVSNQKLVKALCGHRGAVLDRRTRLFMLDGLCEDGIALFSQEYYRMNEEAIDKQLNETSDFIFSATLPNPGVAEHLVSFNELLRADEANTSRTPNAVAFLEFMNEVQTAILIGKRKCRKPTSSTPRTSAPSPAHEVTADPRLVDFLCGYRNSDVKGDKWNRLCFLCGLCKDRVALFSQDYYNMNKEAIDKFLKEAKYIIWTTSPKNKVVAECLARFHALLGADKANTSRTPNAIAFLAFMRQVQGLVDAGVEPGAPRQRPAKGRSPGVELTAEDEQSNDDTDEDEQSDDDTDEDEQADDDTDDDEQSDDDTVMNSERSLRDVVAFKLLAARANSPFMFFPADRFLNADDGIDQRFVDRVLVPLITMHLDTRIRNSPEILKTVDEYEFAASDFCFHDSDGNVLLVENRAGYLRNAQPANLHESGATLVYVSVTDRALAELLSSVDAPLNETTHATNAAHGGPAVSSAPCVRVIERRDDDDDVDFPPPDDSEPAEDAPPPGGRASVGGDNVDHRRNGGHDEDSEEDVSPAKKSSGRRRNRHSPEGAYDDESSSESSDAKAKSARSSRPKKKRKASRGLAR